MILVFHLNSIQSKTRDGYACSQVTFLLLPTCLVSMRSKGPDAITILYKLSPSHPIFFFCNSHTSPPTYLIFYILYLLRTSPFIYMIF